MNNCISEEKVSIKEKLISELIGTFLLVFFGTGAIIVKELTHSFGHIGVAMVFGVVITVIIYAFGHISGGHFNPAVSIAFYVNGDISISVMIYYIISQLAGAVSASLLLMVLFGDMGEIACTKPVYSFSQSFVLELILTFILMGVILCTSVHGKAIKSFAGIAIGATVCLEAMVFGPITGASMNPARSIGPAILSNCCNSLWLYIIATISGAVLAVLFYKLVLTRKYEGL